MKFFFDLSLFAAPLAARMHSISFESPDIGAINFCFVKSVALLIRYIMLGQSYPINPIPTEGGPFGPEQPKTVWHFHSFMAGVTKIYDFVYFSICLVPVKLFWEKKL